MGGSQTQMKKVCVWVGICISFLVTMTENITKITSGRRKGSQSEGLQYIMEGRHGTCRPTRARLELLKFLQTIKKSTTT